MNIRYNLLSRCALLCALACDAQVTPEYEGESLLTIVGSVTISRARTEGKLSPALAFINKYNDRLDIVDVRVRGEFPSNFELDVYAPPPESAFFPPPVGEPRFAFAYITAVPTPHANVIRFAKVNELDIPTGACIDGCEIPRMYCIDRGAKCYTETLWCEEDEDITCNVIASTGDASLKEDPWHSFAGLSPEYLVLYIEGSVPAGGLYSTVLGAGRAMSAGYHLLHVRETTAEERKSAEACERRAVSTVLDDLNAKLGTNYTDLDDLGNPCAADTPTCTRPTGEELDRIEENVQLRKIKLKCPSPDTAYTPVNNPHKTPITVRIEPDIAPTLGL